MMKYFNVGEVIDEAITNLCDILKYKSILSVYDKTSDAPFGLENKNALNHMDKLAKNDGFLTKNINNHAIHIEYGDGEEICGILCHMDVVPVSDNWKTDPFIPHIEDGKIFARGTIDDKGPLMASYYAMKLIKDSNLKISKKIRLIIGSDEESGSRCLKEYFKYEKMPDFGFSPDADFPLIYGEKGSCHFDIIGKLDCSLITSFSSGQRYNIVPGIAKMTLTKDYSKEYSEFLKINNYKGEYKNNEYIAHGVSAHAMHPHKGLNAAFILFKFLTLICDCNFVKYVNEYILFDTTGEKFGINQTDLEMGDLTMNLGIVEIKDSNFKLCFDMRIPLDNQEEKIKANVKKSLEKKLDFNAIFHHFGKRHYVSKDSHLVKTLMEAYQVVTGDYTNKPYTIGGGTYAKFIDNCVAFGPLLPNREDVVHQDDEYIIIEDYKKMILIYASALYALVK